MNKLKNRMKNFYAIVDKASPIIIVVVAAITIVSFNLDDNITSTDRILRLILSLVTILVIASIWDKAKFYITVEENLENLQATLERSKVSSATSVDDLFNESNEPSTGFIASSSEIYICGITLGETVRRFSPTLTERLEAGAKIQILVLDKGSEQALDQLVLRSWSNRASKEGFRTILDSTSELILHISNSDKASGSLEIGYLPVIPALGIILVDPSQENGAAFIEFYKHGEKGSFKFRVNKQTDPSSVAEFLGQFKRMWKSSRVEKMV